MLLILSRLTRVLSQLYLLLFFRFPGGLTFSLPIKVRPPLFFSVSIFEFWIPAKTSSLKNLVCTLRRHQKGVCLRRLSSTFRMFSSLSKRLDSRRKMLQDSVSMGLEMIFLFGAWLLKSYSIPIIGSVPRRCSWHTAKPLSMFNRAYFPPFDSRAHLRNSNPTRIPWVKRIYWRTRYPDNDSLSDLFRAALSPNFSFPLITLIRVIQGSLGVIPGLATKNENEVSVSQGLICHWSHNSRWSNPLSLSWFGLL